MQKIRIFYPTKDNKVAFTKEELEKLINEVYNEGYNDAKYSSWTITTPYYPGISSYPTYTTTCSSSDNQGQATVTTTTAKTNDTPCINGADYGFTADISDRALNVLKTIFQGEDD